MNEMIAIIIISVGVFFNFAGALALVRFNDIFGRLKAAATVSAFGTCLVLFGAFVLSPMSSDGFKALLCILFLILTIPAASQSIARGAYIYGERLGPEAIDRLGPEIKKRK